MLKQNLTIDQYDAALVHNKVIDSALSNNLSLLIIFY
jgi:hypothetical protein